MAADEPTLLFEYRDTDGVVTDRRVTRFAVGPTHLEGLDLDRHASRTFRRDRILSWRDGTEALLRGAPRLPMDGDPLPLQSATDRRRAAAREAGATRNRRALIVVGAIGAVAVFGLGWLAGHASGSDVTPQPNEVPAALADRTPATVPAPAAAQPPPATQAEPPPPAAETYILKSTAIECGRADMLGAAQAAWDHDSGAAATFDIFKNGQCQPPIAGAVPLERRVVSRQDLPWRVDLGDGQIRSGIVHAVELTATIDGQTVVTFARAEDVDPAPNQAPPL